MPSTPNRGLPYPGRHDPPDGPQLARQLATALDARLPGIQVFTASGTWTKPARLVAIRVRGVAGGGGGGGCVETASGEATAGAGGGAGGYFERVILADQLADTESVTVGAAGVGQDGADGTNGGGTSFGSFCSATGGTGGGTTSAGANNGSVGAASGGAATGGDINIPGQDGGGAWRNGDLALALAGAGGSSPLGMGGPTRVPASTTWTGLPASGYGAGGGGASKINTGTIEGGDGSPGIVIIEYVY